MSSVHELDRLFHPKNIAIVGASKKGSGFMWGGNTFIEGTIKMNFQGRIYPVHPSAESILGLRTYKSVREIPGDVDLVIFSIPNGAALSVMEDCAAKKVPFVHVFTAGFSETGSAEKSRAEQELIQCARNGGIRVVGPNCMGVYCPEGGVSWTNQFSSSPGSTGFISQSGQLAGLFIRESYPYGVRFSKVASFGNAADLDSADFLEYLAHDDTTHIISAYIEGLKDGRRFFNEARNLAGKKPLVVWKAGLTEGGERAAQSHTSAIAGSPRLWDALCRQTGIISVTSMEELIFTVSALQKATFPKGKKMAILGGAGGGSVTMTDEAEREGLLVPQLSEGTVKELEKIVPLEGNSVKNPLDMMAPLFQLKTFTRLIELLREDSEIDGLIFSQRVDWFIEAGGQQLLDTVIERTVKGAEELDKPLFVVLENPFSLEGESLRRQVFERFHKAGITAFPSFKLAARIINKLTSHAQYLQRALK
ncbi:MAG: CoA-binding protein [Syntrophales bacterium]|jgi:acyl-CoA synthetase (NDP forming)|nr:CoA-binding protein [Syntrophales bacterium]MDY0043048.1 CoA-binding protein [Syntrophales bacterium]